MRTNEKMKELRVQLQVQAQQREQRVLRVLLQLQVQQRVRVLQQVPEELLREQVLLQQRVLQFLTLIRNERRMRRLL